MREEALEEEVLAVFDRVAIDREMLDLLVRATRELKDQEFAEADEVLDRANYLMAENSKQRKRLLDGYVAGAVPLEEYDAKHREMLNEKATLEAQLTGAPRDDDFVFEQIEKFFHIAHSAGQLYRNGNVEEKRRLLSLIPSNLVLKDRHIASYQLKEPFNLLAEGPLPADFRQLLGEKDSNPHNGSQSPASYH